MKGLLNKAIFTLALTVVAAELAAQSGSGSGSNLFLFSLIAIAVLIVFYIVINVADNLIVIEAKQTGIDVERNNLTVIPRLQEIFSTNKTASYTEGFRVNHLKKGHNILLEGEADERRVAADGVTRYAIQPPDFLGLQPIPKVVVEVGDSVKAGDPIFFDKKIPEIQFVAPVSGEVIEINRGEKRAITEVVILADKEQKYRALTPPALDAGQEKLRSFLLESGAWTLFHQRPYNIIPEPKDVPRDIFISTFDTAPLAPDNNLIVAGQEAAFQQGIDVLNQLTSGTVYLGLDGRGDNPPAAAFLNARNAEKQFFTGQHPAGNVGVQIHHIAPVGGSHKVWTLGVQEVIALGKIFTDKRFDASRVVALVGGEVEDPHYVQTYAGANIGELLAGNLKSEHVRYISGDVLSGKQKAANGYLGWYDDQLTVIEEGDYYELFGWLLPLSARPSISNTFPNFLFPNQRFKANTNTHGEKRAFVMTTDYESVMPMDIYTQQLMKSIVVNDFERMEGLGILELVEEDVALCEFVCVSKQPLQQILREGLETMREQG